MKYKEMLKIALTNENCYWYCKHTFRNINRELDCKYDIDCNCNNNYQHFKLDADRFNHEFGVKVK